MSVTNEREIIVREWHDDKGLIHRREVGQELIRCKECKWRNQYGCHNPIWGDGWANYSSPNPKDDDFCSYGARKESE